MRSGKRAHNFVDLVGKRFTRLLVVEMLGPAPGGMKWKCRCDCGAETAVVTAKLNSGKTKSCGCWGRSRKHGMHASSEYVVWSQMKQRCNNKNDDSYARYGGRGITVCERWLKFENFLADMGARPEGTTLDRIDNDGPYSPENCRWADNKTQYRNRRPTVWIEYAGEKLCRKDWAVKAGIDDTTLYHRLKRGWPLEKALFTAPMNSGGGRRKAKKSK